MNASALRGHRLRALGVEPLRLRNRAPSSSPHAPAAVDAMAPDTPVLRIRRLALHPDPAELTDPALSAMYSALTAAVSKAGLQAVRVCDVAADPSAAVIVFGAAPVPGDVPMARVLSVEALAVLHADRACKRRLWERMQALGRGGAA